MKSLTTTELLNYVLLTDAMSGMHVISFMYQDENNDSPLLQVVEPFIIGDNAQTMVTELLGWSLLGDIEKSGNRLGWKSYALEKIQDLDITDRKFNRNRPEYDSSNHDMLFPLRAYV